LVLHVTKTYIFKNIFLFLFPQLSAINQSDLNTPGKSELIWNLYLFYMTNAIENGIMNQFEQISDQQQ
jgi:hypothetical protein